MLRNFILIACLCLTLIACDTGSKPLRTLTIHNADGKTITLQVEIARTETERMHGLMNRQDLPDRHGMVFVFPDQQPRSFWMKNTPLFLDIIFIDQDGKIVHIHRKARPYDETPIPSRKPARYALEIKGGEADRLGIAVGNSLSLSQISR